MKYNLPANNYAPHLARFSVVCLVCVSLSSAASPMQIRQLAYDPAWFQTGDLIFRRGVSLVSQLILSTDSQALFSHVGLIKKIGDQPYVIHIITGETPEYGEHARLEPLDIFLGSDRAALAAVYRLREDSRGAANSATAAALSYVDQGLAFDADFDLTTGDRLYCTELVWRAYLSAGIDLVDGHFDHLALPLSQGDFLLPSRLASSQKLKLVHFLDSAN